MKINGRAVVVLFCLAGCASTGENLQRATAISVGKGAVPENIAISNVRRGATSVKWEARMSGATFSCSADDMVRQPYCVKK